MANILYRGSAVPSSTNSAGANNAPLTNDQIDKNLYALDLAKFEKSGGTISGATTFSSDVTVSGNLIVSGTTTTINSTTLAVVDQNIELGKVATPTNATADGGGITLKGATDKTIIWDSTNGNWTSNQDWNIATGKAFKINNVSVLNATTLGSAIINSSLTKLGTTAGFVKSDSSGNLTSDTTTYLSAISGDITTSGSVATLANTAVTAGTYGSSTTIPAITIDSKGRITAASNTSITIGNAALTLGINATAGLTNTTVTIGTGTGFTANSSSPVTYDLKVGPALTALATLMTTAGAGFIRRGASADTYTIDTNTYLTSYTEVDTLASVTSRGASTSTAVTFSGGLSATTGSFSGSIGASNFSGSSSGTNTGDQVIPTTLPASDVYAWAKASVKPSYAYSEISGTPSSLPASDVYSWAKASVKPSYAMNEISAAALNATSGSFGGNVYVNGTIQSGIGGSGGGQIYIAGYQGGLTLKPSSTSTPASIESATTAGIVFLGSGTIYGEISSSGIISKYDVTGYGSPSDRNLKDNIQPLTNSLEKVKALQGVSFDWKKDTKEHTMVGMTHDIGLIAQNVQEVLPELVRENENGFLTLRDRGLVAVLIEAIKELNAKVEDLQNQLANK